MYIYIFIYIYIYIFILASLRTYVYIADATFYCDVIEDNFLNSFLLMVSRL